MRSVNWIPKLVAQAHTQRLLRVSGHPRPKRLAEELRRHLPNHDVRVEGELVVIEGPDRSCSPRGPVCVNAGERSGV